MRATVFVVIVGVLACAVDHRPKSGTLDSGRECIYAFLSAGKLAAADEALGDVWDIGPRAEPVHIAQLTWQEDPFHDSYWRFIFYSLRPTANLLWAYYATGDHRYRDKLVDVLRSYAARELARDAALDREKFDNRHTTAFRAMVLVNSYGKLARSGDLPADLASSLRACIAKLGAFMADPHNFEPGQNHGFNEAAALLVVAVNFPDLDGAPAWQALATTRLGNLLSDTIDRDGVEVENSPFYHFYVLSFMWQIDSWAQRYAVALPDQFSARTRAMVRYGAYITQPDGFVPELGSSVAFDVRKNTDSPIYDAIAAVDPEFQYVLTRGAAGRPPTERAMIFPESGQVVLRSDFGADFGRHTFATFNAGKQRTNHSHADALAITYFASGEPLLPDSGVFSYDAGDGHDYFFGTRAHDTIVVDGLDQPPGQVDAGLTAVGPNWVYQSGSHALHDGVVIKRGLVLLDRDLALVVDIATADQPHDLTQTWHAFPGAVLAQAGLDVTLSERDSAKLAIHQLAADGATLASIIGRDNPMQGWHSDQYNTKVPSYALEYTVHGSAARFATLLASGPYARADLRATATVSGDDAHVALCLGDARWRIDLVDLGRPTEAVSATRGGACP